MTAQPSSSSGGLFRKLDCLMLPVDDLDAALAFYRDRLGHRLVWRTESEAGLQMPETGTELVLQTLRAGLEVDLLVASADEAAQTFVNAGGRVAFGPFDIRIGRAVVVEDPWGNRLVLLDNSKGSLRTDADGNVIDSP